MSKPVVLIGETTDRRTVCRLRQLGWGRMWIARPIRPYAGEPWGFDNGAFRYWQAGTEFDGVAFEERLWKAQQTAGSHPRLAVVPDIVGGGVDSLFFSLSWMHRLRRGWPWYLAVQDGMTPEIVDAHTRLFDGIFLGGTSRFKQQAETWCSFAHERGLRFHYGRAGTIAALTEAVRIGADSLDSSFPLWTRQRFEEFARMWQADPRRSLFSSPALASRATGGG